MLNILKLVRGDLRRFRSNVISVIIAIGLVVTPSLFAWYNTLACWDVFNNTGNLKVAVASLDDGYKSNLVPMKINVGEQVLSALRANEDIDWVFTDADDAKDGAASGRYYAAVVLPETFSRDMLDFYADDVEHADIVYYSNEKKSAIAPRITDKGADSVSYKVNQVFAETLSEVALNIANSLSDYLDSADVTGAIGKISSNISGIADNLDTAACALTLYSKVTSSANNLAVNIGDIADKATDAAESATDDLNQAAENSAVLTKKMTASFEQLRQEIDSSKAKIQEIQDKINEIYDEGRDIGDSVHDKKDDIIKNQNAKIEAASQTLSELAQQMNEIAASDALDDATQASLTECAKALDKAATSMQQVYDKIDTALSKSDAIYDKVTSFTDDIVAQTNDAMTNLDALDTKIAQFSKTGLSDLTQAADVLIAKTSKTSTIVGAASEDVANAIDDIEATLTSTTDKIDALAAKLTLTACELRDTQSQINDAITNNDTEALKNLLQTDAQNLAKALSEPVGIERIAVYPSDNFGSAMSPLYSTLALFIGSLLLMVAIKPKVSEKAASELKDPKYRHLFLGRFGIVSILSLCQSTIMALGNMLFLKVQVVHPLLYCVCYWIAGLVFAFIIYTLVSSFANLGKAIAVILLIIQVTGCGGSYPLQILPDFVQAISPFLPATHAVDAMRAAMFGIYNNDFWIQIAYLVSFVVPFLLIGLVLARPFQKFMTWYVEKVEESKLIS
jgi:putative membrane protein